MLRDVVHNSSPFRVCQTKRLGVTQARWGFDNRLHRSMPTAVLYKWQGGFSLVLPVPDGTSSQVQSALDKALSVNLADMDFAGGRMDRKARGSRTLPLL